MLMLSRINLLNITNYVRLLKKVKVLFIQTVINQILLIIFFTSKDYHHGWIGLKKLPKPI